MSDTTIESLLNFPEKFPIKIFGLDNAEFVQTVEQIIADHVDKADCLKWEKHASRKGTYLAITVTIMAQSQAQLDNIYLALTASDAVKMAL